MYDVNVVDTAPTFRVFWDYLEQIAEIWMRLRDQYQLVDSHTLLLTDF